MVKNPPANAGDAGSIPGLRRSPGGVNGNSFQYSCLGNMNRGPWQASLHGTVLMLNRTLSKLQWISVFMLCGGVILVQWKPAQATKVVVRNKILNVTKLGNFLKSYALQTVTLMHGA